MANLDTFSALSVAFLRPLVVAFLAEHADKAWTPTRLGREAVRDPSKIFLLLNGQQIRQATALRILAVIEQAAPGFAQRFVAKHAQENLHAE